MVTFESDQERFAVLLADPRAAEYMAIEDGGWQSPDMLAKYYRVLRAMMVATLN